MSRHQFKTVHAPIDALLLDTVNPRIRSAKTQQDCIDLVMRQQAQMLNLIKSIAHNGLGTMPILLYRPDPELNEWVVKDGNRRVTALKLLNNPSLCSDAGVRGQLDSILKKHKENIPTAIDCLESYDLKVLAREVLSRHGGAMDGVGQLPWEAYLRTVFQLTSDMTTDNKRAGQYLLWAEINGIPVNDDFPITTLTRFFSELNLKRLGFNVENDQLVPNLPHETARHMTLKVITDFGINKMAVTDVFTADKATAYIDLVRKMADVPDGPINPQGQTGGAQPTPNPEPENREPQTQDGRADEAPPGSPPPPPTGGGRPPRKPQWDRKKLFWRGSPSPSVPITEKKAKQILFEIGKIPKTQDMPVACVMLLRALLEVSVNDYMKRLSIKDSGNLAKNTTAVATSLFDEGVIDKSLLDVVKAYAITDRAQITLFNIDTIQKYVHRDTHLPEYTTLHTMWDEIGGFVRACWSHR